MSQKIEFNFVLLSTKVRSVNRTYYRVLMLKHDMFVYIVYSPQNIMGGGHDTQIRGVYFSFEEAEKSAQHSADLDTFQDWLNIEIKYKYLYDKGHREVSYLRTLEVICVPVGTPMNQEMTCFTSSTSVEATYDDPIIRSHPKFDEYKKNFDMCIYRK